MNRVFVVFLLSFLFPNFIFSNDFFYLKGYSDDEFLFTCFYEKENEAEDEYYKVTKRKSNDRNNGFVKIDYCVNLSDEDGKKVKYILYKVEVLNCSVEDKDGKYSKPVVFNKKEIDFAKTSGNEAYKILKVKKEDNNRSYYDNQFTPEFYYGENYKGKKDHLVVYDLQVAEYEDDYSSGNESPCEENGEQVESLVGGMSLE